MAGIPAMLLLPENTAGEVRTEQRPAIMVLHDHGAFYAIGKEKSAKPISKERESRDIEALAQKWVDKLYDGMYVADSLAELGYIVLVPDAPGWGENAQECGEGEWPQAILEADRKAYAYLRQMPEVDTTRIYATGFSMGAYRAWMLAASESTIAGCAAFHWMQSMPCTKDWCWATDYVSIASSIAPRPFLLVMGNHDRLFPIADVRKCAEQIKANYGENGEFEYRERDDDHHFRRDAYEMLKKWLVIRINKNQ